MTIPSERVFMTAYDQNLADAERLQFKHHWVVGMVLFFIGAAIENPSGLTEDMAQTVVGLVVFGLLSGIISKFILMRVFPGFYAMLAMRLGLAQPAA